MAILHESYCGDEEMSRLLEKAGARTSLSEVYGLFYGCLAAPHSVTPARYYPLIFGDNYAALERLAASSSVIRNLMTLWNLTGMWNPEEEPAAFPDITYPVTYDGTAKRLRDAYSLIEYFVKGLDLGHVAESDFSKGGFDALKSLSETGAFIHNLADLLENEKNRNNEQLEKALESVEDLEAVTADCIAKMNISLKEAREREEIQLDMLHDPDADIHRDSLCVCGSGKKYKRCCGIVH
jgi:uncharacterized protein YecA (UPF0149 family)